MTTSSPKERDSGRSRGFAFVRFFDKHDAEVIRENWEKWKKISRTVGSKDLLFPNIFKFKYFNTKHSLSYLHLTRN